MSIQPQTNDKWISETLGNLRFSRKIPPLVKNRLTKEINALEAVALDLAWQKRGMLFSLEGKEKQAIEALKIAIKFEPSAINIYNLGFTYELFGKLEKALECYQEALNKDNLNISLLFALANRFSSFFDYQNALILKQKLAKLKQESDSVTLTELLLPLFGNEEKMSLFGLQLQAVVAKYIPVRFIKHFELRKFDEQYHIVFLVHCETEQDIEIIAECNSSVSDFIVQFEEEQNVNLSALYIYYEASND